MQRYFFHYRDDDEVIDHVGVELPGITEARTMAVISAAEAIGDLGERFWREAEWSTWVTDESGATVCTLKFSGQSGPGG